MKTIVQFGDALGWQGIQYLITQYDTLPWFRGGLFVPHDPFLEPSRFMFQTLLTQGTQDGAWFHDVIAFGQQAQFMQCRQQGTGQRGIGATQLHDASLSQGLKALGQLHGQ
jgi:hypothetical protein